MKRRAFLWLGSATAGGLLVGCAAPPPRQRLGTPADFAGPDGEVALNAWVRIAPDGQVVVAMPRTEMGQGVHTALAMLVAEEMGADWSRIAVQSVTAGAPYGNEVLLLNAAPLDEADDGGVATALRQTLRWAGHVLALNVTGGSSSLRDAWGPMRWAGAAAREQLLQAAARHLGVPPGQCRAAQGHVEHPPSARRVSFAEVAAAAAQLPPPSTLTLRPVAQHQRIGHATPRLDAAEVVRGARRFGSDAAPPGSLQAAVLQCPVLGGRLRALDPAPALAQPGVRAAFALDERTVVVVADRFWRAHQALQRLQPQWDEAAGAGITSEAIAQTLAQAVRGDDRGVVFRSAGDAQHALAQAAHRIEADYEVPFLAHAALEPQNCTALVGDDELTLWCPTQVPLLARLQAARAARVWPERVRLHVTAVGGGFGRRLETDVVVQAVKIAARFPGTPVHLAWSRDEDTRQDSFRPAAASRLVAALGPDGWPQAWSCRVAAPSVLQSYTARLAGLPMPPLPDRFLVEGAFDLPYAIPHLEVRHLRVPLPVPVGFWRSVGYSYNVFFIECFVDELAQAAGADPLAYRRALLAARPRHLAVLALAARQARWGEPLPRGHAHGLALHAGFGSVCAMVAQVSMVGGLPRVHRVTCAVDCGLVVNPLGAAAQVEGAIAFGLGAALAGDVSIDAGRVRPAGLVALGVLPMSQMPPVAVHFVPSHSAPEGLGEVAVPPVAPALANAVSVLTGRRIRRLPLTRALADV